MRFRIIILIAVVCGLFLVAPVIAHAETGTCSCSGTISVKNSAFASTFDGYCDDFASYCSSCGGGTATCSIDFNETREKCEGINSDPAVYFRSIGVPEIAITQLNFDGSCTFAASGATKRSSTASTKSTGYSGKLLPSCIRDGSCSVDEMVSVIGRAAQYLLGIVGSVTLLLFIYGGLIWLTSGGNPDKIKKGRDIIIQTVIGLAIVFGAYASIHFLVGALGATIPSTTIPKGKITEETCPAKHSGWACSNIENRPNGSKGCEAGLCLGPANKMCCPPLDVPERQVTRCQCKCQAKRGDDILPWHDYGTAEGDSEEDAFSVCARQCREDYVPSLEEGFTLNNAEVYSCSEVTR